MKAVIWLLVAALVFGASPCHAYTEERNLGTFGRTLMEDLREFKGWIDNMDELEWGFVVLMVWIVGVQGEELAMRAMGKAAPGMGRSLWRQVSRLVRLR